MHIQNHSEILKWQMPYKNFNVSGKKKKIVKAYNLDFQPLELEENKISEF